KLVDALAAAGIELIGEGAVSHAGGRGGRLKRGGGTGLRCGRPWAGAPGGRTGGEGVVLLALGGAAVLIRTAALAVVAVDAARAAHRLWRLSDRVAGAVLDRAACAARHLSWSLGRQPSVGTPVAGSAFPSGCAFGLFPCRRQSRRGRGQPVRA